MSYDFAVWYASRPITCQEADEIYGRLYRGDQTAVKPDPRIAEFLDELTERYPEIDDLDDEDMDDCPWSNAFDRSEGHAIICMRFSLTEEVLPFVEELASEHGLVYFDPQTTVVMYPPHIAAMPHLRISMEDGTVIDNPTPGQIANTLSSLNKDENSFAILEQTELTYIQTGRQPNDEYVIEYQESSIREHFQTFVTDLQRVIDVFQLYAAGNDSWKQRCEWEQVDV